MNGSEFSYYLTNIHVVPNLTTLSSTQTKPKINTYVIYQYIEENSRKLKGFGLNFCSCPKDSLDTKEIMSLE